MMISFWIENIAGERQLLELPPGSGLSLMELLRAADQPIAATCGGIALCATCMVSVIAGNEALPAPGDAELDMLDTLPLPAGNYRLSCQIRIDAALNGCVFRLAGSVT